MEPSQGNHKKYPKHEQSEKNTNTLQYISSFKIWQLHSLSPKLKVQNLQLKSYSLGILNIWPLGVTLDHVITRYLWISLLP